MLKKGNHDVINAAFTWWGAGGGLGCGRQNKKNPDRPGLGIDDASVGEA